MLTDCFNKNRVFVMGISILFIVLLHTHFHLPFVLHFLRRMGYIYVDLFMMLSGYGLYFSLTKNGSLKAYFKKRAKRILPTYYILAIVYLIFEFSNRKVLFTDVLGVLTTMSFWSGQELVFSWFAQSLVAFYVLAPLMVKAVHSTKKHWCLPCIALFFILPFVTTPRLFMAISRVPVFVCGMCFAKSIKENGDVWMKNHKWEIFLAGVMGFFLLCFFKFKFQEYLSNTFGKTYYILFLPAILMVPSLAIIFSTLCNMLSKLKLYFVNTIVNKMGDATFEIYLVQSLFYMILFSIVKSENYTNIKWFLIMTIAIVGGYLFSRIIRVLSARL